MFGDDALKKDYVPQILGILGERPGGVDLRELPGLIRARVDTTPRGTAASLERKVRDSVLVLVAKRIAEVHEQTGGPSVLHLRPGATPVAGASPSIVMAARTGQDYRGEVIAELEPAHGHQLAAGALRSGVKARVVNSGRDFYDSLYHITLGIMMDQNLITPVLVDGADGFRYNAPTA